MEIEQYGAGVFTVANFLDDEECQQYIEYSHYLGYEEA